MKNILGSGRVSGTRWSLVWVCLDKQICKCTDICKCLDKPICKWMLLLYIVGGLIICLFPSKMYQMERKSPKCDWMLDIGTRYRAELIKASEALESSL